jgi:hypothetical protein
VRTWIVAGYELPRPHPYSKPPTVSEYVLARVYRQGDLALDPFAGSGSSRTAAENLGLGLRRKGCDIDPEYAESGPRPRKRLPAYPEASRRDLAQALRGKDAMNRKKPCKRHPPRGYHRSSESLSERGERLYAGLPEEARAALGRAVQEIKARLRYL